MTIKEEERTPRFARSLFFSLLFLHCFDRIYRGSFSEWEEKGGEVLKPGQPYEFEFEDSSDDEVQSSCPAGSPCALKKESASPSCNTPLQAPRQSNKSL